jgi:hypothetical protein
MVNADLDLFKAEIDNLADTLASIGFTLRRLKKIVDKTYERYTKGELDDIVIASVYYIMAIQKETSESTEEIVRMMLQEIIEDIEMYDQRHSNVIRDRITKFITILIAYQQILLLEDDNSNKSSDVNINIRDNNVIYISNENKDKNKNLEIAVSYNELVADETFEEELKHFKRILTNAMVTEEEMEYFFHTSSEEVLNHQKVFTYMITNMDLESIKASIKTKLKEDLEVLESLELNDQRRVRIIDTDAETPEEFMRLVNRYGFENVKDSMLFYKHVIDFLSSLILYKIVEKMLR